MRSSSGGRFSPELAAKSQHYPLQHRYVARVVPHLHRDLTVTLYCRVARQMTPPSRIEQNQSPGSALSGAVALPFSGTLENVGDGFQPNRIGLRQPPFQWHQYISL